MGVGPPCTWNPYIVQEATAHHPTTALPQQAFLKHWNVWEEAKQCNTDGGLLRLVQSQKHTIQSLFVQKPFNIPP